MDSEVRAMCPIPSLPPYLPPSLPPYLHHQILGQDVVAATEEEENVLCPDPLAGNVQRLGGGVDRLREGGREGGKEGEREGGREGGREGREGGREGGKEGKREEERFGR
jgi:hypothetical protein